MNEPTDVPLICDIPPGGLLVVTADRPITREQAHMLRETVEQGLQTRILVLDHRFHVERIDARQWPDAEFCAA